MQRVHLEIELSPINGFCEEHTFNCSKKTFIEDFKDILNDFVDDFAWDEMAMVKIALVELCDKMMED
jgi:hypothetical protein